MGFRFPVKSCGNRRGITAASSRIFLTESSPVRVDEKPKRIKKRERAKREYNRKRM
jgi:hypothetical protein